MGVAAVMAGVGPVETAMPKNPNMPVRSMGGQFSSRRNFRARLRFCSASSWFLRAGRWHCDRPVQHHAVLHSNRYLWRRRNAECNSLGEAPTPLPPDAMKICVSGSSHVEVVPMTGKTAGSVLLCIPWIFTEASTL